MGSNPAPNFFLFFLFFSSFFFFFSILRWFLVKSNPLHLHSPLFFMILIIPNIVQNLYLNLSMPFILGLHPPYPTSPTYPKPCYPTSTTPTLDWTPPPDPPPPYPNLPPLKIFFFEFSQKLYFSVHIHPDPPPQKKKKNSFFGIFTKASILRSHPP